jgi:hypothetical protein
VDSQPATHPWRRYLRFSMRGLIVLVLAIGAGLGWFARSARIQREALLALEKTGASVSYKSQARNAYPKGKSRARAWLEDFVGIDYIDHIVAAHFSGIASDREMTYLGCLTAMERLYIEGLDVTDSGFAELRGLTSLQVLSLPGAQVTDVRLAHLKGMTNLTELELHGGQITGAGLAHLSGLINLTDLDLSGSEVSDAGLANLERMNRLSTFNLSNTRVSDAGLAHLKGLASLTKLFLNGTRVTDAGLLHLKALGNLEELDLGGTSVTADGMKKLNQTLPMLMIMRHPSVPPPRDMR